MNGTLFFNATNGAGSELWKSNGTAAGTVRVSDFPGTHEICTNVGFYGDCYGYANVPNSTDPRELINLNGKLYFSGTDDNGYDYNPAARGRELWSSDGTPEGTAIVADVSPGTQSSYPQELTNVNGTLFFKTHNHYLDTYSLWKSDGTSAGTVLLKEFGTFDSDAELGSLTNVNGVLYFNASVNATDRELWKSNGTRAGTVRVKDINPGIAGSNPRDLFNFKGTLFFSAEDTTGGRELWKSNGTSAGTVRVKQIAPGALGSDPTGFVNFHGKLYFSANDGRLGEELWMSDGTSAGTRLVQDINISGGSNPTSLTTVGNSLFFAATSNEFGTELHVTVATPTLHPLADITLREDAPARTVALAGIGSNPAQPLRVTASSSNPALIRTPVIQYTLPNSTGTLRFQPIANRSGSAIITVTVENAGPDGDFSTTSDNGSIRQSFRVTVTPVNDAAPVLRNSLNPTLAAVKEDTREPVGSLVTRLVAGISDVDFRALKGVAVIGVSHANRGRWEYSLNGGQDWKNLKTAQASAARLLPANAQSRIRFIPTLNFNGTVKLFYRAWDQTQGIAGGTRNLSSPASRGGTTAFSTATEYATLTVTAVNDAPKLTAIPNAIGYTQNGPAIRLASSAILTDPDSDNLNGGRLQVRIVEGGNVSNRLDVTGAFSFAGNNVRHNGQTIGTRNAGGGVGTTRLEITFNTNVKQSIVQQLVRAIRFGTVASNSAHRRTVEFALTDGDGGVSDRTQIRVNISGGRLREMNDR